MTSACELKFDDMSIAEQKAGVPDEFVFLFQERDRRVVPTDAPEASDILYVASRAVVLQRLDLGGFTAERAATTFQSWLDEQREMFDGYDFAQDTAAELRQFTYEDWGKRLKEVLSTRYALDRPRDQFVDEIDRCMRDLDGEWIFFADLLTSIRAMLDALPDIREVSLDVGQLIYAGWIKADDRICESRRSTDAQWKSVLEPTVIIAEGSTDNLVLKRSLQLLYPKLSDSISFFDYEETNVDGGASYQVKFLRAFAAARINTSIVAIFDNDAAGVDAFNAALRLKLPANIRVTRLPDIELARCYPTIGPQGNHEIDVNGKAVSIEMFLGRRNLARPDGTLTPIVWGNFIPGVQTYQGKIEDKRGVLERFLQDTAVADENVDYIARYNELNVLWQHIFGILKSVDRRPPREDE